VVGEADVNPTFTQFASQAEAARRAHDADRVPERSDSLDGSGVPVPRV
jgi:hypothetical protein